MINKTEPVVGGKSINLLDIKIKKNSPAFLEHCKLALAPGHQSYIFIKANIIPHITGKNSIISQSKII